MSPHILLLETSSQRCAVAISKADEIMSTAVEEAAFSHASKITVLIEQCLQAANLSLSDLNAIAVSNGPGSYTALRVGLSTAKGMCHALNIPLISVDTLYALAQAALTRQARPQAVVAMLNARRDTYYAYYANADSEVVKPQAIRFEESHLQAWLELSPQLTLAGSGIEQVRALLDAIPSEIELLELPLDASFLARPALRMYQHEDFADLAYSVPQYVKAPHITQARKLF